MRRCTARGLISSLAVVGALAAPSAAHAAEIVYGTTGTQIVRFNATTPSVLDASVPITGLPAGVSITGLDERPAALALYGLGSDGRLYRIGKTTGRAVLVGGPVVEPLTGAVGIDFNPAVDRVRVVTSDEQNLRVNPNTGSQIDGDAGLGGVQPDVPLSPAGSVSGIAYDRTVAGATQTTLFGIDAAGDRLVLIGSVNGTPSSPNAGVVTQVGPLGLDAGAGADLDISAESGLLYALLPPAGGSGAPLFARIDPTGGAATVVGTIGLAGGAPVTDIAVAAPPPTAVSLLGTAAPQSLIRYPVDSPADATSLVPLAVPAGQVLTSLDRRPQTGQLIAAAASGTLFSIDEETGTVTEIGAGTVAPAAAGLGFDIDPVTDVLRVVTESDLNVRLDPFAPGFSSTLDPALAYDALDPNTGTNPVIDALGYTNSTATATSSVLYAVDTSLNVLARLPTPDTGKLTTVGSLGVDPASDAALDFPPSGGGGYLLYTPQATSLARIGIVRTETATNVAAGSTFTLGDVALGANTTPVVRALALQSSGQVGAAPAIAVGEPAGVARITLTRTVGSAGAANVEYDVTPGTAGAGTDMAATGGTVTFEDRQTTATIEVPIVDDGIVEDPESFTVTLKTPGGGLALTPGAGTATVFIVSDDVVPAAGPAPPPGPVPVQRDMTSPIAILAIVPGRLAAVRSRGLPLRLLVGEACRALVVATVDAKTRRRLKLKSATVSARTTTTLSKAQARALTLKLTKDAKKRFARTRSVVITVTATVTDLAGNRTVVREKVTLRR